MSARDVFMMLFLVIAFICLVFEKNITMRYLGYNVYGRVYAFFAVDFLLGGIVGFISVLTGSSGESMIPSAIIALAVGIFMYVHAIRKSPQHLQNRCFLDLTISGLGVNMRVSLFFMCLFVKNWLKLEKAEAERMVRKHAWERAVTNAVLDRFPKVNERDINVSQDGRSVYVNGQPFTVYSDEHNVWI